MHDEIEMSDKQAIGILSELIDKYPLEESEVRAIKTAIGILSWSTLIEGRMKSIKKSQDTRSRESHRGTL